MQQMALQEHRQLSRLKMFAICLALSNPSFTFDTTAWIGLAL
jgi:hypothetical protein